MRCWHCNKRVSGHGGSRSNGRTLCMNCWLNGWHFDANGEVKLRRLLTKADMDAIRMKNWRKFAARNFTGGDAA